MSPVRTEARESAVVSTSARDGSDLPAPLREALAALRLGLAAHEPFLLLTGAAGTGKTTVGRRLLEQLDAGRYELGGMFGSCGGGEGLLSHIVQDFGVRPSRPGEAFLTLEQFLRRWNDSEREAVLVIDEAQALDAQALRQLRQLAVPPAGQASALHVLLISQQVPPAVAELTRAGSELRFGARAQLRPLRAAETREFVLRRLRNAGRAGQPAFGQAALEAIHERSAGTLRRIALLCDRIPMWLAMEGAHEVSPAVVDAVDAQLRSELAGSRREEPLGASAAKGVAQRLLAPRGRRTQPTDVAPAPILPTANDAAPAGSRAALAAAGSAGPADAPPRTHATAPTRPRRWWMKWMGGFLMLLLAAALVLGLPDFLGDPPWPSALEPAGARVAPAPDHAGQPAGDPPEAPAPTSGEVAEPATTAATPAGSPGRATELPMAEAPAAAAAACSGPSEALGLCPPMAAPELPAAQVAQPGPRAVDAAPACAPARTALGLCDPP